MELFLSDLGMRTDVSQETACCDPN